MPVMIERRRRGRTGLPYFSKVRGILQNNMCYFLQTFFSVVVTDRVRKTVTAVGRVRYWHSSGDLPLQCIIIATVIIIIAPAMVAHTTRNRFGNRLNRRRRRRNL